MNPPDLFEHAAAQECDHLPTNQRKFIDGWLVCWRCGKRLRGKDMTKG